MPKANVTHDITIREVGSAESTARGFMLAANRRRLRGHKVGAAQTLAPRVLSMGELSEAENPPDIEMVWSQENWNLGIGGINHRTDPDKLASGNKIDTSEYGTIKQAPNLYDSNTDMAPTTQYPTGFAKVGTELWTFYERQPYSYQATGPEQWLQGATPEAAAKAYRNGVEYQGNCFVPAWDDCNGDPATYIYKSDADCNWTLSTLATKQFKYFAKGRNACGDEILWGGYESTNVNEIRSSTDPTNCGSWSTAVAIGDTDSPITALVDNDDTLLICKTDGIWSYAADGTTKNLTPQFQGMAHEDNFRGAYNWNGHILLPLGRGGMVELVNGRLYDVSLERYLPDQEVWGDYRHNRVVAITGDPTRLFIAVAIGNNLHILMADWLEWNGRTDYRWHHMADYAMSTFGPRRNYVSLFADGTPRSSLARRRVWIAGAPIDNDQDPQFLPIKSNNDSGFNHTDDTDARAITTLFDAGFPHVDKAFQAFDADFLNVDCTATITVDYRVNGGAWTNLGTLNDCGGSQTLNFTDGTTGKTLELRFTLVDTAGPASVSPTLLRFRVTLQLRPTRVRTLPIELYLADQMQLLNGSIGGSLSADLSQLNTWSDQAAEVIVKDSEGTEIDMVVLPGSYSRREVAHEWGRRPEYVVSMVFVEVG